MRKMTSDALKQLIQENSAEAAHVDFKQEWHRNKAKLIHDILCLSNADYAGDRVLLFGINDNGEIIGLKNDENRKDNASLFDLLTSSHFNRLPDINIYTVTVDGADIDVIQIANSPYKPYFLTKDKTDNGTIVRAGGIVYSRNGSRNTPINSSASAAEIENMWRERFGLDQTPAVRIKEYLLDIHKWHFGQLTYYYKPFPEFTVQKNSEVLSNLPADQEWTRGCIGYHYKPGNFASQILICYHQTCLAEIYLVNFDGDKRCIVAPSSAPVGAGRFYYYLKDSLSFAYQKHMALRSKSDDSTSLKFPIEFGGDSFDIPVFQDETELQFFLGSLGGHDTMEPTGDPSEQNRFWYENFMRYKAWRETNPHDFSTSQPST